MASDLNALLDALPYAEIRIVDAEFQQPEGGRVEQVHCVVTRELRSGRLTRQWAGDLDRAPFSSGRDTLVVGYMTVAEVSCFLELGWPVPEHILDCYVEFLNHTNGLARPFGTGLVGALEAYGLPSIGAEEKEEMRRIAIRGAPFDAQEREDLLDYCQSDVDSLARLFLAMLPRILLRRERDPRTNLAHALLRGRYMADVACMERVGVPLDAPLFARLRKNWDGIRERLVARVDQRFGVYDGTTFKAAKFQALLERSGLLESWPRTPSGQLALDDETFRQAARASPGLAPLHELRATLGKMRLNALVVDAAGRHRATLWPFKSKTGRNQPSNSKWIFGPATWIRSLIRPEPGTVVVYPDWSSQEIGIAAALSGDEKLMADYRIDAYIEFAKRIGLAPPDATKKTHPAVRDGMKAPFLAIGYGAGAALIASRTGRTTAQAEWLLQEHRRTYPRLWAWLDTVVDHGALRGFLETTLGWNLATNNETNPGTLKNYLMQANGAEMMRLAIHDLHAAGITVVAPVHDALLLELPEARAAELAQLAERIMEEASARILGGFRLRVSGLDPASWVRPGGRYSDPRGKVMWDTVMEILEELENGVSAAISGPG